jgi:uncharacterized membrane protein YhiD involved in acid resistance
LRIVVVAAGMLSRAGGLVPAESSIVHTVTEAAKAGVDVAVQVAAGAGVLSEATFGQQFFCCSPTSQCMVTKSCKQ